MQTEPTSKNGGTCAERSAAVQPREAVRSGAGLDELEAALQVLVRHAGRDGGYSPYYDQWQSVLHGLGRLIASKRRDSSNKR